MSSANSSCSCLIRQWSSASRAPRTPRPQARRDLFFGSIDSGGLRCNPAPLAHVFLHRTHCPRGGLSPRRGRAGVVFFPCRLAAGGSFVHSPSILRPSYVLSRAALLAGGVVEWRF